MINIDTWVWIIILFSEGEPRCYLYRAPKWVAPPDRVSNKFMIMCDTFNLYQAKNQFPQYRTPKLPQSLISLTFRLAAGRSDLRRLQGHTRRCESFIRASHMGKKKWSSQTLFSTNGGRRCRLLPNKSILTWSVSVWAPAWKMSRYTDPVLLHQMVRSPLMTFISPSSVSSRRRPLLSTGQDQV